MLKNLSFFNSKLNGRKLGFNTPLRILRLFLSVFKSNFPCYTARLKSTPRLASELSNSNYPSWDSKKGLTDTKEQNTGQLVGHIFGAGPAGDTHLKSNGND